MKFRILIVDDNKDIHKSIEDALKVHSYIGSKEVEALRVQLFDKENESYNIEYIFSHAYQGEEAVEMVKAASIANEPYSLMIVDSRMPPGIDGPTVIEKVFDKYDDIDIILLTAYSDLSWDDINNKIKYKDQFVYLKKPFDLNVLRQIVAMFAFNGYKIKGIKNQLKKMSDDLEKRTRELNNTVEDYIKVEEETEKALNVKHEFISTISHELKTPLTAAISVLKAFEKTTLDDTQQSYLRIVNETHDILLQILDNILDFSRLENDSLVLHEIEFDYKKLVKMNVAQMQQTAEDRGNALKINADDRIPEKLIGDPGKIRQIYTNLLGNAIKFTSNGSIDVLLELLNEDEETVTILTTIVDTGIGIDAVQYEKIFDNFSQADSSIQRQFGGVGIGLNVSRKLVNKMKGDIGVASKMGEGSNFTFNIILKKIKS